MSRRSVALVTMVLAFVAVSLGSALPVGASRVHDVDPTGIDPKSLALPASSLPPGATVTYSAVSDNADADTSRTHEVHSALYETWHRISGYRMDFTYTAQGVAIDAGYLASIFPTSADARAAMDNATNSQSIIAFLGHPLPDACTAGETCLAFSGPNPDDGTKTALIAIDTRGPVLIEAAAQVPNDAFAHLQATMEAQVYAVANAEDAQVKTVLSGSSGSPHSTDTVTPTSTATATATATPTATPRPAKPTKKKCKKGYKRVHGKCKRVKKHH